MGQRRVGGRDDDAHVCSEVGARACAKESERSGAEGAEPRERERRDDDAHG